MNSTRLVLALLCILSSTLACVSTSSDVEGSLTNFSDTDIAGIWKAEYSPYEGVEVLTLNKDKTYSQVYEDPKGYLYSGTGTWEIEIQSKNRIFVRLNNALWFPFGSEQALRKGAELNPLSSDGLHRFYDHQNNKFLVMDNILLLDVVPRSNSKGFVLFHFAWDLDSPLEHFEPVIK